MKFYKQPFIVGYIIIGLLLPVILISEPCNGQKILIDKIDPFSNNRTVIFDNVILVESNRIPLVQIDGAIYSGKDSTRYVISLLSFYVPGMEIQKADSAIKMCMFKKADGSFIEGKWIGSAQMPLQGRYYDAISYSFTKDAIQNLASGNVVALKFVSEKSSGIYDVDQKHKSVLALLCSKMLKIETERQ